MIAGQQKRHFLFATALVVASTMAGTAYAGCRIFQHRDFGGSGYTLDHFEEMKMVNGESLGCSTGGHGDGCLSTIFDASWNDQVSSFRVTGGCTLTLWEHVNRGGARFRSNRSYKYVGSGWNDKASHALCMCR